MLLVNAQTTGYWSAQIGRVWNGTGFQNDTNISGQAWTQMTWNQSLGIVIQQVSNKIHQLTLRGGANWMVVSPSVASVLETIPDNYPKYVVSMDEIDRGRNGIKNINIRDFLLMDSY